jgi:hypothetical protein
MMMNEVASRQHLTKVLLKVARSMRSMQSLWEEEMLVG